MAGWNWFTALQQKLHYADMSLTVAMLLGATSAKCQIYLKMMVKL